MRKTTEGVTLVAVLLTGSLANGQQLETEIVNGAIDVLNELTSAPDRGIPARLLREAQAVAVFPHTIKAGFVIGGRHGRGVILIRREDNSWSHPVFLVITGGSVGFQVGAQATDLVLVFRTRGGVDQILSGRGRLKLGADVSIAAGPIGRESGAATDLQLRSEIFSYSRSRGLFAGASLGGASIQVDWASNSVYYASDELTPAMIARGTQVPTRESAQRLMERIQSLTAPPPQEKKPDAFIPPQAP